MGGAVGRLLALGVLTWVFSSSITHAQESSSLARAGEAAGLGAADGPRVTRGPGAEACPDVHALRAKIATIGGPADAFERSRYTVAFAHSSARGGTFSARIRRGDDESERLLEALGGRCRALAHATALTLALLLDHEARGQPPPPPEPLPSPSPAPSHPPALPAAQSDITPVRARTRQARALVALGGAGLLGVLRPVAPALWGELAYDSERYRLGLGALWALPHERELGPGSLRARLASGAANLCAHTFRTRLLQLSACSGLFAGVLRVEANGYTTDRERKTPWLAVPLTLGLATRSAPVGLSLTVGALVPIRRHDFSIDGLGRAYRSWPVAALIALQITTGWPRVTAR